MEKLNLKWVSETIGNDYKNWKKGDTVLISAQTGTGKTYFVKNELLDNLQSHEKLLLVCNRRNLKRQLKKDLLEKYGLEIPEKLNDLDGFSTINDKVTITSYHAISDTIKDEIYGSGVKSDFSRFDYIVFDECHFIFSDGSFNNKTRFAYDKIVREHHPHAIKIFISATMEEIRGPIRFNIEKENVFGEKPTIHEYTTGNDYSYVKPKYFKQIDTIINLIKNDTSKDKWLIFISDIKRHGERILEEIGEKNCSIIKSGTKSEELNYIINNSRFTKKVLVCTKAMDNGINISDSRLKNIVIMTWDRVSFIQMLGRKRIDINNPEEVNLFIPTRYKKSFYSKLLKLVDKKKEVDLLSNNETEFNKKYENDLKDFEGLNDLFYHDTKTGKFKINLIGRKRLHEDIKFAQHMIEAFESNGEYAFIHEQLSWLGLSDPFPDSNMLDEVIVDEEVVSLTNYLESIVGKKLFNDEQQELSDLIIKELITIPSNVDYRTKKLKPSTLEKIVRDQLNLPYAVSKPIQETKGEMKKKRYIIISKIN